MKRKKMAMQKLKLKVCGMRELENIQAIDALSPDFMGFIFYNESKRYIGNQQFLPQVTAKKVGVFVDESTDKVQEIAREWGLDFIQLHGNETRGYCRSLFESGLKLIKAFSIAEGFDFRTVTEYEPFIHYFLFDAKGELRGGNGVTFDWHILESYNGSRPFFLSGGIAPGNVHQLKEWSHPKLFAIDVNSGVEIAPGLKSVDKLKQLISNLK